MRCNDILTEIMGDKAQLRRTLLDARTAIPAASRALWDAAICERVLHWQESAAVRCLGVYAAMRGEPDLSAAYAVLTARGIQLALPVVQGQQMRFIAWRPGDVLVKDGMGVLVPAAGEVVQPGALLVPCVGFNAQTFRIGYGGGYYDRLLAMHPRPAAAGIAYSSQLAEFEVEAHDIALDLVITEA